MLADTAPVDPYAVLAFEAMLEAGGIPLGHNARPVQPVGSRMLQYYGFDGQGSQQKQMSSSAETAENSQKDDRVPYKQPLQRQVSEQDAAPAPPPSPPPSMKPKTSPPPTREFTGKDAPCFIIPTKVSEIRGMLS